MTKLFSAIYSGELKHKVHGQRVSAMQRLRPLSAWPLLPGAGGHPHHQHDRHHGHHDHHSHHQHDHPHHQHDYQCDDHRHRNDHQAKRFMKSFDKQKLQSSKKTDNQRIADCDLANASLHF